MKTNSRRSPFEVQTSTFIVLAVSAAQYSFLAAKLPRTGISISELLSSLNG